VRVAAAPQCRVICGPMADAADKVLVGFPTDARASLAQSFLPDTSDAAMELLLVPIVCWSDNSKGSDNDARLKGRSPLARGVGCGQANPHHAERITELCDKYSSK
jgi:hypothetical protein